MGSSAARPGAACRPAAGTARPAGAAGGV
jgi:hypothetical protein